MGTPWSGPHDPDSLISRSATRAVSRDSFSRSVMNELSFGSVSAIRSKWALTSSTGDNSPLARRPDTSDMVMKHSLRFPITGLLAGTW